MPSHNPYQYIPVDRPRIVNWPKIILWGLGILILAFIIVFFIMDPLNLIKERTNDLLNDSIATETNFVCPDGNNCICNVDTYNCDDFTTQEQAQAVFDYCFNYKIDDTLQGDVHQL